MCDGIVRIDLQSLEIESQGLGKLLFLKMVASQVDQCNSVWAPWICIDRSTKLLERLVFLPLATVELSEVDVRFVLVWLVFNRKFVMLFCQVKLILAPVDQTQIVVKRGEFGATFRAFSATFKAWSCSPC